MTESSITLTRDQVREIDRRAVEDYGFSGLVLMENAGGSVARYLIESAAGTHPVVTVFCGKGNNGGDGFVIARHLANAGLRVGVFMVGPPESLSGDAATNFHIAVKGGVAVESLPDDGSPLPAAHIEKVMRTSQWVIDALLGIGLTGPARPPYDQLIELMNRAGKPILSVDIPSGLHCDTGDCDGPLIRAAHTATFVARKAGFGRAAERLGEVRVIDIGVPRRLIEEVAGGQS